MNSLLHELSKTQATFCDFNDILLQRKWWRHGSGEVVRRKHMNINHKMNSLAYLLREAPRIATNYSSKPVFNGAPDEVWAELDYMMTEPEKWMISTPMWRALLQDIMAFADIGPRDIGLELALPGEVEYSMTASYWRSR